MSNSTPKYRVLIFYMDPTVNVDEYVDNWDDVMPLLRKYISAQPLVGEIMDIHVSVNL